MRITSEIVQVLVSNPRIKNVYFTKDGGFSFIAHNLPESKDSKELKLYSQGKTVGHRVIPGEWNVDKIKEPIEIGLPNYLIVKTVTRAEALSTDVSEVSELISNISTMSADERRKLKELLFADDEEVGEDEPKPVKKTNIKKQS